MTIITKLRSALTNHKMKVYAIASPLEIKVVESNDTITYKDTTQFIVPITSGLVVKIYDGDTFTIASKLPYEASPLFRFSSPRTPPQTSPQTITEGGVRGTLVP